MIVLVILYPVKPLTDEKKSSKQGHDFLHFFLEADLEDIFSIILAAGAGSRMGGPKALALLGKVTFLDAVTQATVEAGFTKIAVVLAHGSAEIQRRHDLHALRVLHNADPSEGPISSIRTALGVPEIRGAAALLVHPVDHPLVMASTLKVLVDTFRSGGWDVVVPTFEGRGGHPTLFSRRVFPDLLSAPPEMGARYVVRREKSRVLRVEVEDRGVRMNLDTPEDLDRLA